VFFLRWIKMVDMRVVLTKAVEKEARLALCPPYNFNGSARRK
jgi:hypothetical protein